MLLDVDDLCSILVAWSQLAQEDFVRGMNTDNLLLRRTEAELTRSCYVFIACIFVYSSNTTAVGCRALPSSQAARPLACDLDLRGMSEIIRWG